MEGSEIKKEIEKEGGTEKNKGNREGERRGPAEKRGTDFERERWEREIENEIERIYMWND